MVNADMFKDAFVIPKRSETQTQPVQPVQSAPVAPIYVQEDPEIAKLRVLMLKLLSIIVGGAALLLIIWRVILKFF